MANYFLDTEFSESCRKPISWLPTIGNFNRPYYVIELISIGIVCEDGRECYAISNEFDIDEAWDKIQVSENGQQEYWLRDNVLKKIYDERLKDERYAREYFPNLVMPFSKRTLKNLIKWQGRTNYQIACDIMGFVMDPDGIGLNKWLGFTDDYFKALREHGSNIESPTFYGNYSAYDWVLFCSVFGDMMALPKSFPRHCIDLKQMIDEKAEWVSVNRPTKFHRLDQWDSPETKLRQWESTAAYPKQTNSHHALADSKFNFELYKFLQLITEQTKQKEVYASL